MKGKGEGKGEQREGRMKKITLRDIKNYINWDRLS